MGTEHEILKSLDAHADEHTAIAGMLRDARHVGGYLHIEIRREARPTDGERFWILDEANEDNRLNEISAAVGAPVSGLVDEVAGGLVAYLPVTQGAAHALADLLNAVTHINPQLDWQRGNPAKLMVDYTHLLTN